MKKIKGFFSKIWNYIKNSAWIQPILIVVVIFIVLFSLNPIANAIRTGWDKLTTVNKMEQITFQEYTDMVKAQADNEDAEDLVFVFTSSSCDVCPIFYRSVNEYLKLTGGTLSGNLTLPSMTASGTVSTPTLNVNTINLT